MIRASQLRASGSTRPLLRLLPQPVAVSLVATRSASLSAIHRGLYRSEKAQYGDSRPPRSSDDRRFNDRGFEARRSTDDRPRDRRNPGLTSRAFDGAGSARQQHKLRKKLDRKDEEEDDPDRQTRRKRFLNPDSKFGKQSLVYQLKHGALKDEAAALKLQEPVRAQTTREFGRDKPRGFGREPRAFNREKPQGFDGQRPRAFDQDKPRAFDREKSQGFDGDRPRAFDRDKPRAFDRERPRDFDREPRYSRESREPRESWSSEGRPRTDDRRDMRQDRDTRESQPWSRTREPRSAAPRSDDLDEVAERGRKRPMMAMNIKYTTAASQFLYGKSVVKAALEQSRRKLYHLYIYGGDNRKDSKDNTTMTRLADRHDVPITIIPNGEQRLMDKMSMGRPHNGFVLEASPLPQLPVTSLGRLEETPTRLGFHIELDFQTKEEEAVNGTDTFVPRSSNQTPKPFVLLLNEILDPGNLGALLRTASYLGVDAVGITNRSSSTLTPVVLKSAAGAVEEITIFTVDSPVKFIEDSKAAGWKTYAAVAPPERKLIRRHGDKFISTETIERESPLDSDPCILIMGNEGHGLSKPIKVAADYEISVPRFVQHSCVDSLNVSVAAGLLCHAFVKEPVLFEVEEEDVAEVDEQEAEASEEKQERPADEIF